MTSDHEHITPAHSGVLPDALPADAPAWAVALFNGLSKRLVNVTEEVETLRRVIAPRLVSRREAARIADVSTRTIRRYEDRGLLHRAPTKGGGAFYAYDDIVKLKRMIK